MDWAELDLTPPYPSPASLNQQLTSKVLSIDQRRSLLNHALGRACLFADFALLTFLLSTPESKNLVDLNTRDEDGLCIISQSILGFGSVESDRTVDREECIRLLISQGAPITEPDLLGWSPLHHAALRAPPTLIVHLLAHGASSLAVTNKLFTPLDLIRAYQPLPDRQDVALILQESMREQGWIGSPLEQRRDRRQRQRDVRNSKNAKSAAEWSCIGQNLGIDDGWWGESSCSTDDLLGGLQVEPESGDDLPDEIIPDEMLSPPVNYNSMLVFSPSSIPDLLQRIVVNADTSLYPVSTRSAPANALYFLARFACIHCDDTWLDALMSAALDRIEAITYARPDQREDIPHTAFWLYNTTLLLHLMKCDLALVSMCESIDVFFLLEELIRSLYAFILRGTERRLQAFIQSALLDFASLATEFESVQFESDWSFFRSLTPKRKQQISPTSPLPNMSDTLHSSKSAIVNGRNGSAHPPSPSPGSKAFSSLRQSIGRGGATPLANVFSQIAVANGTSPPNTPNPSSITAILSSLHSLLRLYSINPAIIIQAFSQIYYWIACETFNKVIVQKKYLCRSRAMQIGLNISALEEWVTSVGLPSGVSSHFQTLRELLVWLQCHSSIDQFTSLIDTVQTMKSLNPIQMRRAVRDYRYEVSEPRMDEECAQYLIQLQKDWERRRVRMGIEALQKEFAERRRDRAESVASTMSGDVAVLDRSTPPLESEETEMSDIALAEAQQGIDRLFDRDHLKNEWIAPAGPAVLGELMDTSFPLRLTLPSNPELLAAWPGPDVEHQLGKEERDWKSRGHGASAGLADGGGHSRSASRASIGNRGAMEWRLRSTTVRTVAPKMLVILDGEGVREFEHGAKLPAAHIDGEADNHSLDSDVEDDDEGTRVLPRSSLGPIQANSFTKRPKRHSKLPRESSATETIVPPYGLRDSSQTPEPRLPDPTYDRSLLFENEAITLHRDGKAES